MGPKRDVVGEWQKAAQKYGLRFGVSEHLGASFTWFQSSHRADKTGPLAGVAYDPTMGAFVIEAGTTRLRPILMTSFAMVGGMLPLFLALGAGAEMRAPMARAVVGGLITSTMLTLIVVPVFFEILEDFTLAKAWAWIRRRLGMSQPELEVQQPLVEAPDA